MLSKCARDHEIYNPTDPTKLKLKNPRYVISKPNPTIATNAYKPATISLCSDTLPRRSTLRALHWRTDGRKMKDFLFAAMAAAHRADEKIDIAQYWRVD